SPARKCGAFLRPQIAEIFAEILKFPLQHPSAICPFKLKHFHFLHETSTLHGHQANVGHPDV
ncbi:hypothetical protein, partial [Pantoea brenneri]|uniref:hypothetical protein n=1 Tax=Pantoea brenneri TaxID=472694 RepID=UPI0028A2C9A2